MTGHFRMSQDPDLLSPDHQGMDMPDTMIARTATAASAGFGAKPTLRVGLVAANWSYAPEALRPAMARVECNGRGVSKRAPKVRLKLYYPHGRHPSKRVVDKFGEQPSAAAELTAAAAAMRAGCSVPAQEPASKLTYG